MGGLPPRRQGFLLRPLAEGAERIELLLVEPVPAARRLLRDMLQGAGIARVREAETHAQALDMLRRDPADGMILDWADEVAGAAFLTVVRGTAELFNPFLPVIVTMANPTAPRAFAARDSGADEILAKPLSLAALHDKLAALMTSPRDLVLARAFVGPTRRRRMVGAPEQRRGPGAADADLLAPIPAFRLKIAGEETLIGDLAGKAAGRLIQRRRQWLEADVGAMEGSFKQAAAAGDGDRARAIIAAAILGILERAEALDLGAGRELAQAILGILESPGPIAEDVGLLSGGVAALRLVLRAGDDEATRTTIWNVLGLLRETRRKRRTLSAGSGPETPGSAGSPAR